MINEIQKNIIIQTAQHISKYALHILLILCVSTPTQAETKTVWGRGLFSSSIDFKAFVEAQPHHASFVTAYVDNMNNTKHQKILPLFQKAQKLYFQGKIKYALEQFLKIKNLSLSKDWSTEERRTIYFSILRMAELETVSHKKQKLIEQAISFAPEYKPEPSLFNPKLITLFEKLNKSFAWEKWTIPHKTKFDLAIVNSHIIHLRNQSTLKIPKYLPFRLTLLNNTHHPLQLVTTFKKIKLHTIKPRVLTQTHCGEPLLSPLPQIMNRLYFSNNCVHIVEKNKTAKNSYSQKHPSIFKHNTSLPNNTPRKADLPNTQKPSLIKNKWFWIILGSLAGGVILSNQKKRPSRRDRF